MRIPIEKVNDASLRCPEEIMTFTDSHEYNEKIQKIGRDFKLQIDQVSALSDEVLYVLIGLTSPTALAQNIKSNCNVSPENVVKIIALLNSEIFAPIREYIQKESEEVDESHRDSILGEIENPTPAIPKVHINTEIEVPRENLPKKEVSYPTNWMFPEPKQPKPTEQGQVVPVVVEKPNGFEQILKKPTQTSAPQNPIPAKNYGSDPYRESVE